MLKKYTILFFAICYGICSCNKESSTDYPSVQISAPYSLAAFSVPGSIQVTGHVNDTKSLTKVTVYIANSQNIPVEQEVTIPVTSKSMNVSCSYLLNDVHLATGEYYMTITASNGANTASAFQQIYIDAEATKRTAIYAITRDGSGVHAWKIDSLFHASLSYSVSGDYSSSDINSYYQQLYIAAYDSGNVNVYSVPAATFGWSINGSASPSPYFTNVYCYNDDEFISCYNSTNGYIKCFNHGGGLDAEYNSPSGYYPTKSFLWNGWVFAEEKSVSLSGSEYLWMYYQSSTVAYQQILLTGPVVALYGYDDTHIFVFGNKNGGGPYMEMYNIHTNLFYSPITLPSAELLSVAQINANTYLIGFNNGAIYQYTFNPNSIVPCITGINASTVRYDSINNQIIASSGNTINLYGYGISSANFISSAGVSDSVRDVRILYNK